MSLDYDFTEVDDWEALHGGLKELKDCTDEEALEYHKTINLAFVCMAIQMNGVSEANYQEFWTRTALHQGMYGAFLSKPDGTDIYYSLKDIHRRIGFSTNVYTESRTHYLSHIKKLVERDCNEMLQEAK